jgi:hypothetical protein
LVSVSPLEEGTVKTKQISVFIENRVGRLASVAQVLKDESIDIRALSMADAPDFGIFRIVVEDTHRARAALKQRGFVTEVNDVIAVEVEDRPGGLADVLAVFAENHLNVEYMYAFLTQRSGTVILFFRFEETDRAIELLGQAGIPVLEGEQLWSLVR